MKAATAPRWLTALLVAALAGCLDRDPAEVPEGPLAALAGVSWARGHAPLGARSASGATFLTALEPAGPYTNVLRSADGGLTWEDVTPPSLDHLALDERRHSALLAHEDGQAVTFGVSFSPRQISIEQGPALSANDALCTMLLTSRDDGATWSDPVRSCGEDDRDSTFRLAELRGAIIACGLVALGDVVCRTPTDGPWMRATPVLGNPRPPRPAATVSERACDDPLAFPATAPGGALLLAWAPCGRVHAATLAGDATAWRVTEIGATSLGFTDEYRPRLLSVAAASDDAGTLYVAWIDKTGAPALAWSRDVGATWSEPLSLASDAFTAADRPALVAGGAGRVVLAYLATDHPGGYQNPLPTEADVDGAWAGATWRLHADAILHADGPAPIVRHDIVGDPVARGACGRTPCGGIGGSLHAVRDADGTAWVAFADACTESCLAGGPGVEGPIASIVGLPRLRDP